MSPFEKNANCKDIAPLLVFYLCDEVSEEERGQVEAHLANCSACSALLAEEHRLHSTMLAGPQPADELDASGILLAQCRSELAESLDDLSAPPLQEHWRPFGWLRGWMALRPVWSGALLILFGALAGTQVLPWLQNGNNNSNSQAMSVTARPPLTPNQLANMTFSGINISPSSGPGAPNVQLQLNAEQPIVLSGSVEDSDIRGTLTYVVENGERFDAGLRLDCLEALKAVARDQQVRSALIKAALKDQNPAVRMKALEALRGAASDDGVRQALLEALQHDSNPGVRVEAVNMLVASLQGDQSDTQEMDPVAPVVAGPTERGLPAADDLEPVVRVLQRLQRQDPSRYVRLRSAAALRQIGPREEQ
jgi:hypothetical protein